MTLKPGEHYASADPCLFSTLLGSCVAVCLYDPTAKVAGMNHFLLANRRYARKLPLSMTEAGRYGVHSMEILINALLALGADKRRLTAKAFGAGAVLDVKSNDNFSCVGEVNERFIREFLKTEAIYAAAMDLGGSLGRVIRFRTDTYTVYRRFIRPEATKQVEKREHGYWRLEVDRGEQRLGHVTLFKDKKSP